MHRAFSLIEILLSLGIIAILAAIVFVAINPTKHLNDARAQDRNISMREIENAISQYTIDGNTLSGLPMSKSAALLFARARYHLDRTEEWISATLLLQ